MKLWLAIGMGVLMLSGCAAEDYAREEGFTPRSGAEVRAERLLNDFSDDLDDEDFTAACEKMTPLLQLHYAIESGRRNDGCETAMRVVARAGSLGNLEVEGTEKAKHGLWADAGEVEFLVRKDRIANMRRRMGESECVLPIQCSTSVP